MILITYGTRPEYIKVKPLIYEMTSRGMGFKTLFTGQHKDMVHGSADFNLEMVDYIGNRLDSVMKNCLSIPDKCFENITHILVQGDTTSVVGLAMTAMHRKIKVIHLEAGLRTHDFDNPFPEENNRRIVSSIANIHLCPTELNLKNLEDENAPGSKYVVGNTVLDNLLIYKKDCEYQDKVLITLHRRENHAIIEKWFKYIDELAKKYNDVEFILPIHPNPNVKKHQHILKNVTVCEPLEHNELIKHLIKAKLVITDSGGIQEECSFFNKKCLVCRKVTERPEAIGYTSFIVDKPSLLTETFEKHFKKDNYIIPDNIKCPFGDGNTSSKICDILNNI